MTAEHGGAAGRASARRGRGRDLDRYHCEFLADPIAVREVLRAAVARFARRLSVEEAGTLELALAEVLNTVVEHGYAGLPPGPVTLELALEASAFGCRIVDEGRPMPDLRLPQGGLPPPRAAIEELDEGGWGWALIRALTTNLRYTRSDGRNELSFRLVLGEA